MRAGAIQAAHHRADFHALLIGHLLVGLAVDGGVDEHLPAFRREFGERGHDFLGREGVQIFLFSGLEPVRRMFGGIVNVPIVVFTGGVVGTLRAPLGLGILVEVGIALDGGHPRLEVGARLE